MTGEFPFESQPWRPTCSVDMLKLRARMLSEVRRFFAHYGYTEVETPLLSHDVVVDAHLEPFIVNADGDAKPMYLQTSPEAGMKRLLAAGSVSIFQITRSFRRGEVGQRHNPEFTIVEWYGVGTTYRDQMELTEALVHWLLDSLTSLRLPNSTAMSQRFKQTAYDQAFHSAIGESVLGASLDDLQTLVADQLDGLHNSPLPNDRDDLLNLLLAECVEPKLGVEQPEFLYDYPISQAALAEQNPHDARTACRFELYSNGIELCNGYQELVDPDELQRREAAQNTARQAHATAALPGAARMKAAMQSGLPKCSGVALGFDRLLMCLTGADSIADVIPFPFDRA